MQQTDIEELTQKLLPLTFFRRNAGEVLEKLPKAGTFIITKDGIPIATLSSLIKSQDQTKTEKLARVKKLAGGLNFKKSPTPEQINRILDKRHDQMLPRQ